MITKATPIQKRIGFDITPTSASVSEKARAKGHILCLAFIVCSMVSNGAFCFLGMCLLCPWSSVKICSFLRILCNYSVICFVPPAAANWGEKSGDAPHPGKGRPSPAPLLSASSLWHIVPCTPLLVSVLRFSSLRSRGSSYRRMAVDCARLEFPGNYTVWVVNRYPIQV